MGPLRSKIVLVDDNLVNLEACRSMLRTFYEVYPAPSAAKLFEILEHVQPNLILLDIEMPGMSGYEAINKLKSDLRFRDIPVIFLTSKNDINSELEGFDLGAVDYITKPFSGALLLKRIRSQLLLEQQKRNLLASQAALEDYAGILQKEVQEKNEEVLSLQSAMLAVVSDLVEFRDKRTGKHTHRTQLLLKTMINGMIQMDKYTQEISHWDIESFLSSALIHDVGKIAITDLILNKPGKLTPEEFEIMKTHVAAGVEAIEKIMANTTAHSFLHHALFIAGTHHEKWDGSGYPMGLKGQDIPLEGRLMAVVDVYDALVSERPYKPAFSHEEAKRIIQEGSGTHFDPELVDIFLDVSEEFSRITQENID